MFYLNANNTVVFMNNMFHVGFTNTQAAFVDEFQIEIESVKEMIGNYLHKVEFYQLCGDLI